MDDALKDLPPEERIKKLKELEEKKKREIAEAEELIKESEKEMTGRDDWLRKVPIPEIGKEDLSGLGVEGKELLKTHKGISEEEVVEEESVVKKEESLEETIGQENIKPVQEETQLNEQGYDSIVSKNETAKELFKTQTVEFPRSPLVMKFKHKESGEEFTAINIHLKC